MTLAQIGAKVGLSAPSVLKRANWMGLDPKATKAGRKPSPRAQAKALRLLAEGKSVLEVARAMKMSRSQIYRYRDGET